MFLSAQKNVPTANVVLSLLSYNFDVLAVESAAIRVKVYLYRKYIST